MAHSLIQLVNNYVDSYNGYNETQRKGMTSDVLKNILDIDDNITLVYKQADAKKYPMRNNFSDSTKSAGSSRRIEAFTFVGSLSAPINKGNFESEQRLLTEITNAMNRKDLDYTSGLIDATDNGIFTKDTSKFGTDLRKLKKEYFAKIGINDITKDVKELETRKAEFELILDAIEKNDSMIILPRQFNDVFSDDDVYKNPKAREVSNKLVPHVNRSMQFLSERQADLKG